MRRDSKHTVEAGNVVVKLKSTVWAEGISKQTKRLRAGPLLTDYICD